MKTTYKLHLMDVLYFGARALQEHGDFERAKVLLDEADLIKQEVFLI